MSARPETQTPIVVNERTGDVEVGTPRPVGLSAPGSLANSALWFLIVLGFVLTMLLAAAALLAEFLAPSAATTRAVDASMVLLIFTSSGSFLTGLVIPSPLQRR
jgi:hypothetical protein